MPIRSLSQQIGDAGQKLVEACFEHPYWVARTQSHDFGIDLEAELAEPIEGGKQRMTGKLIKLQIKARAKVERNDAHIAYPIPRDLLHYADAFRLPVILAIACLETKTVWWLWLQEWSMLNEDRLAEKPDAETITAHIPIDQTLDRALKRDLPAIAMGSPNNAMILALRNMIEAATGWENGVVAEAITRVLGEVHGESRGWILSKVTAKLFRLGDMAPFSMSQQVLPVLNGLVEVAGGSFNADDIVGLVRRGESYSRTGLIGLSRLYDIWPEHMRSLGLVDTMSGAGAGELAWYCAMRERYPMDINACFGLDLVMAKEPPADLAHGGYRLDLDADARDYIMAKWPNRGDSVLIDCLRLEEPEPRTKEN